MRHTLILLALTAAGGLLGACASSTHSSSSTHPSAVARTGATASTATITKPRALAFAHAVNITAADVPGFTASSKKSRQTAQEKQLERAMLQCVGSLGTDRKVAEVGSKEFELNHGIVDLSTSSEVSVAQTAALAARELAAYRSARVRGCFAHFLGLILKGQRAAGATVGAISIASGVPPAPGTAGGFGWRATATLGVRGLKVPFYVDILGFVYGPSTVTLFSSGVLEPFPAAAQQRLYSTLLKRAKVHAL
jgi:hypothetical protein